MSLNEEQKVWLARYAGYKVANFDTEVDINKRLLVIRTAEEINKAMLCKVHLDQMREDVEAITAEITDAFQDDITLKGGETMPMIKADQTKAFDWWADIDQVDMGELSAAQGKEGEQQRDQLMSAAKAKLTYIEQRMLGIPFLRSRIDSENQVIVQDDDSEFLFEKPDLIDELYTPLVRAQILPETFVEDEFSEVQQMIQATNDPYIKELESAGEHAERNEYLGLAKATIDAAASIATDAIDMNMAIETWGAKQTDVQKAQVAFEKGVATLVAASMTSSIDLVVNLSEGEVSKAASSTLASMAKSTGFLVEQLTGNKEIGNYVSAGMSATANTIKLVKAATATPMNEDGVTQALVGMVGDGFAFSKAGLDSTDDASTISKLNLAAQATKSGLEGLIAARKAELITSIREGKWDKIRTLMVALSAEAARTAFNQHFPDKISKTDANLGKIKSSLVSMTASLESSDNAQATQAAELQQQDDEKAWANATLEQEKADFENGLELLGQRDVLEKGELAQISAMIAKLKRDQAIISGATAVGSAGFAVAQQFLAPMAIAGTLVKFTATLAAAIDRSISMKKWVESHEEALATASPYISSISNFVKSQGEQFTHKSIQASLLLLRVAAQITATAGTGTPVQAVATVVDKGLSMAATLADLTYKFHQEGELRKAWKLTKFALDNPQNRKANLIARAQNPTLAKYSIAYGAVIAKDIIAISALNRIGLTRETLAQKDASVANVKSYLETRYADDIKVLRQYTPPEQGWGRTLPEPALTARSWMLAVQIARDDGQMRTPQDANLNRIFTQTEEQLGRLNAACASSEDGKLDDETIEPALQLLQELLAALQEFDPVLDNQVPCRDMYTYKRYVQTLTTEMGSEISVVIRRPKAEAEV